MVAERNENCKKKKKNENENRNNGSGEQSFRLSKAFVTYINSHNETYIRICPDLRMQKQLFWKFNFLNYVEERERERKSENAKTFFPASIRRMFLLLN